MEHLHNDGIYFVHHDGCRAPGFISLLQTSWAPVNYPAARRVNGQPSWENWQVVSELSLLLHFGYFCVIKVMTYQTEEGSRRPLINTFQQARDKSNNGATGPSEKVLNASPALSARRQVCLYWGSQHPFLLLALCFVCTDGNFILLP